MLVDDFLEVFNERIPERFASRIFGGFTRISDLHLVLLIGFGRNCRHRSRRICRTMRVTICRVSANKLGNCLHWSNRGGQCDSLKFAGEAHETVYGSDQMRPALGTENGVNLVENYGRDLCQDGSSTTGTQEKIQALRGGDENFGRVALHLTPIGMRRVSTTGQNPDIGKGVPRIFEDLPQSSQRLKKVSADVVVERFQG